MSYELTYMPSAGVFIEGLHEEMPTAPRVIARQTVTPPPEGQLGASATFNTYPIDPRLRRTAEIIAASRGRVGDGALTAADFDSGRALLDPLILIRLHNQLQAEQMKWFHLDNMYNTVNIDKLLYRMPFRDNPAMAQVVARRQEYDITKVEYGEIKFDLPKVVTSWDIAIEDELRPMLNPTQPLQASNNYAMDFHREKEALAGLQQIKNYYDNAAGTFSDTVPTGSKRLPDPSTLTAGNVHSDNKFVDQVQIARNKFMETNDLMLTHFACNPVTAMHIAQNTWTSNNTIFNVEAYRTNGGVRQFPGLDDAQMVISQIVPAKMLFAICKPAGIMWRAEGPKLNETFKDPKRFTRQVSHADFHQYKCAHEDLTMSRKFGCSFVLA